MYKALVTILIATLGVSVGFSQTFTDGNWSYTLNESKEATITSYRGTDQVVTIPSSVDEHPVRSLGGEGSVAGGPQTILSITIPDSVTRIGNLAFAEFRGLTSMTIPDGVTSIGDYAFRGCAKLTSVSIPDSVTSIGVYAFSGCDRLTGVSIPDSVTSIGEGAFYHCGSLTSVTIPNSVTSIGDFPFFGCVSLTSVKMPSRFSNQVDKMGLEPNVITFYD